MQGADSVNNELEVGFDETFETRWSRIERGGYVVLALLIAAGLSGLLGRGPLSHCTTRSAASDLVIDHEPIARSQTDTQVTFHLDNPTDASTTDLFVETRVIELMASRPAARPRCAAALPPRRSVSPGTRPIARTLVAGRA